MWQKKGLVYAPDGQYDWNKTHAHVVCPDFGFEDKIRVVFSSRDAKGRCMASYLDVSSDNPQEVLSVNPTPILELGKPGMFDDCGIMPTWLLHHPNGERWLYYIGWTVRNTIPYHNAIGIAVSRDGGHYERLYEGPVINPTHLEPLFSGSCCVLHDQGMFRMWYLNCTEWVYLNGRMEPCYNIKYAESVDGINWQRNNTVAIPHKSEHEGGISRPCVIREADGTYTMWYSYRAKTLFRGEVPENSYRIGVAKSLDGIHWERQDDRVGIDVSATGWDYEMICYPMAFDHRGQRYLYYNGNGHGHTGFGMAVWQ